MIVDHFINSFAIMEVANIFPEEAREWLPIADFEQEPYVLLCLLGADHVAYVFDSWVVFEKLVGFAHLVEQDVVHFYFLVA